MASTTFFLWPKMKLLNQRRTIVRFEPRAGAGRTGGAGTATRHEYTANEFACAPVAAAMAIRSVIEHSAGRFGNLTTARLRPGSGESITQAQPAPISDSTTVDFYDVALMNLMTTDMKYQGATKPPFSPPSVTRDGDKTTGLGLMAELASEFKASVRAVGTIAGTRRRTGFDQFGIRQNRRSYPRLTSSQLIDLLNDGNGVVLGFDIVLPRVKDSNLVLDKNGNKIWVQSGVGHAVAVNGFGIHAQAGDLFRVYDPLGVPAGTGPFDIDQRVFVDLHNGTIEYVKLSTDDTETTVIEELEGGPLSEIRSIKEDNRHGHPIWIFNPFDQSKVEAGFEGRILTSIATLKIGNNREFLDPHEIDDSEMIGQRKIDRATGTVIAGNAPRAPAGGKARSTPSPASAASRTARAPARKKKTAKPQQGTVKMPGKK